LRTRADPSCGRCPSGASRPSSASRRGPGYLLVARSLGRHLRGAPLARGGSEATPVRARPGSDGARGVAGRIPLLRRRDPSFEGWRGGFVAA
jgi:hypothetical protein